MLFALILVIIAYLLLEPSVVNAFKAGIGGSITAIGGGIKKLFQQKEDNTTNFLAGIDNTPLTHEEISEFRTFLTTLTTSTTSTTSTVPTAPDVETRAEN